MKFSKLERLLIRGSATAMVVQCAGVLLAFCAQLIFARMLGDHSYGIYAWALAIANLIVLPAKLGLDAASLRFVPELAGKQDWSGLKAFLRGSTLRIIFGALVSAEILVLLARLASDRLTADEFYTLLACGLLLPPLALLYFNCTLLKAWKKVLRATIPWELGRPVLLLICYGLLYAIFGAMEYPALFAMLSYALSAALLALLTSRLVRALEPRELAAAPAVRFEPRWMKAAYSMMLISSFAIVFRNTDIIMLGFMQDKQQAGYYSAASRITSFIQFGLLAVNTIAAPLISELYFAQRMKELQRMITLTALGNFCFSLPAALGVALLGHFVLGWFGPAFVAAYPALLILTAGQLISSLCGSVGYLMTMTGREQQAAWVMGQAAVLNIVLNLLLIPYFGMNGAALATTLSYVYWRVALTFLVRGQLQLDPLISSWWRVRK